MFLCLLLEAIRRISQYKSLNVDWLFKQTLIELSDNGLSVNAFYGPQRGLYVLMESVHALHLSGLQSWDEILLQDQELLSFLKMTV